MKTKPDGTLESKHEALKDRFRKGTEFSVARYLMSCAPGRVDEIEQKQRHQELVNFFVVHFLDCEISEVSTKHQDIFDAVYKKTRALIEHLETVINFPKTGTPDYDSLEPAFFEEFYRISSEVLFEYLIEKPLVS